MLDRPGNGDRGTRASHPPGGARDRALHVQIRAFGERADRLYAAPSGSDPADAALPRAGQPLRPAETAALEDAAAGETAVAVADGPEGAVDDRPADSAGRVLVRLT